jgi:hypothetical protein
MDDHVDLRVLQREQVVRLDHLEPLVHQGGRVDRDLRTHLPDGMRQRLLHGCLRELAVRPPAERPARPREDHALHVLAPLPAQALREGGMLGVHRDEPLGFALDEVQHELAADDQALLVGQGEGLARLQRREGRRQSGRTNEGVQDHVRLGVAGEHLRGLGTRMDLHASDAGELLAQVGGRLLVGDRDVRRQELADLADQQLLVGPSGQADDLEPVGVATHDVERLRPHRSRRPEDHQRAHRNQEYPDGRENRGRPTDLAVRAG